MIDGPAHLALLFGAGLVAGAVNVLAGGGSFLTLPVLIFLGLPASVANATNRVGIFLQNVGAVWSFRRAGVLDFGFTARAAAPAVAGAVFGTWAALHVADDAFRRILAFLMIALTIASLWRPRPRSGGDRSSRHIGSATTIVGFLAVGFYAGFVQAGVGFLILAITTWSGFDLVRGNAVKVTVILAVTTLSLAWFAFEGRVDWTLGLALAAGTVAGGQIGVRLTVLKGHKFVRGVVTIAVIVLAIRLWWTA